MAHRAPVAGAVARLEVGVVPAEVWPFQERDHVVELPRAAVPAQMTGVALAGEDERAVGAPAPALRPPQGRHRSGCSCARLCLPAAAAALAAVHTIAGPQRYQRSRPLP